MLREDRDSRCDPTDWSEGATVDAPRSAQNARQGAACDARVADDEAETTVLAVITDAVLHEDRSEGERQLRGLLDRGIDRCTLIDDLIPRVARDFGEAWCLSGHSFAEVTIAVARLQGWLRDLEPTDAADPFRLDAPEVLLVVPVGCQHTLGAMVALSRFHRLGALVRLSLGRDARAIGMQVRSQRFDMIAISAAGNEDLDFLAGVINSIRSGVGPSPRIVLGGEILNHRPDAPVLVGADFGTSDPEEALELCGLTNSEDASGPAGDPPGARRMRGHPARAPGHM